VSQLLPNKNLQQLKMKKKL